MLLAKATSQAFMRDWGLRCQKFMEMYSWVYVYIAENAGKKRKCKRKKFGSFQVNKSKHILSIRHTTIYLICSQSKSKQITKREKENLIWNSQFMSKTKLVSLGSTSFVFKAWHVNIEFRSDLCTDGQSKRFSITSPELCSYWSSTCKPFMSHRTCGCGRPVEKEIRFFLVNSLLVELIHE